MEYICLLTLLFLVYASDQQNVQTGFVPPQADDQNQAVDSNVAIHETLLRKYGLAPTKENVEPISVLKPKAVDPKQFCIPKIGAEDYEKLKEESRVNLQAKVDL